MNKLNNDEQKTRREKAFMMMHSKPPPSEYDLEKIKLNDYFSKDLKGRLVYFLQIIQNLIIFFLDWHNNM